jgi:hypothetical protein
MKEEEMMEREREFKRQRETLDNGENCASNEGADSTRRVKGEIRRKEYVNECYEDSVRRKNNQH